MLQTQDQPNDRIINPSPQDEDTGFDPSATPSIRPKQLSDYIGQKEIKENLDVFIQAAKARQEPLEHLLFYGPPGLGKTTLAYIIGSEMDGNVKVSSGPALDKSGDVASLLSNLESGDILFIDEIHRLRTSVEEVLYSAMEDFYIDITLGKGPSARSVRLDLPPFTLIWATTKVSNLTSPLRDRFGSVFRLQYYEDSEIESIIHRSAQLLDTSIDNDAAKLIAHNSRQTPRIANRLIKRMRDYAQILHSGNITKSVAKEGLSKLRIYEHGLDHNDIAMLQALQSTFNGKAVGLSTLSSAISEEKDTIENVYEPYLIKLGFIEKTPRGRMITKSGADFYEQITKR